MKTPSAFILARMFRCAEQETPMDTGQDAACLVSLSTRASMASPDPPNWAPRPHRARDSHKPFFPIAIPKKSTAARVRIGRRRVEHFGYGQFE